MEKRNVRKPVKREPVHIKSRGEVKKLEILNREKPKGQVKQQKKMAKRKLASEKADKKVEKARKKLPTKKRLKRAREYDEKTGKVTHKWKLEKEIKRPKPKLVKKGLTKVTHEVKAGAHKKISQVESENSAVEAAHKAEKTAASGYQKVKQIRGNRVDRKLKKYQKLEKKAAKSKVKYKAERYEKYNSSYKEAVHKNDVKGNSKEKLSQKNGKTKQYGKSNVQSKRQVKKRVYKEQRKKMKEKAAEKSLESVKEAFTQIFKKKKGSMIALGVLGILFLVLISSMSSCIAMFSGGGSYTVGNSYVSQPEEIDQVENHMLDKEVSLQETIDHIEIDHPGFDEYRYSIDEIGHDPFQLVSYMSAIKSPFTYVEMQSYIDVLYNEMYEFNIVPVEETRTRVEHDPDTGESYEVEYQVMVLEVTLKKKTIQEIADTKLTEEQKRLFNKYNYTHGALQQLASPVALYWYNYVGSYFGPRKNPNTGIREDHTGIDIVVPEGTKVKGAMLGTITEVGWDDYYGNYVKMSGDEGIEVMYGHLQDVYVTAGQKATRGMYIGTVGSTGVCYMPHVHVEVMQNGVYYNPVYYLEVEYAFMYAEGPGDGTDAVPPPVYDSAYAAQVLEEAKKYLGYPYVWGGSNPSSSFDCSGFVCWVYTNSGARKLPRTTAQGIYNQCVPISGDEVQAGDLVFFTRTYNSGTPVTHVGIYCGNGVMIHCGDPIKYANLSSQYWVNHFYGYGRLK